MCTPTFILAVSLVLSGTLLAQNLNSNEKYKLGISALNDHLYKLAISKFDSTLAEDKLSDQDKTTILLAKTEAQIRATLPSKALDTLASPLLEKHIERTFWQGTALIVAGRFADAETTLKEVSPISTYFDYAQLSLANLKLTLNKEADAENLLIAVSKSKDMVLSDDASIKLTELYLTNKKFDEAYKVMTAIKGKSPFTQKTKKILSARILFYKKDYSNAANQLKELLLSQEHVSKRIYNNAEITLIDALHASGHIEVALAEVISRLDKSPNSPIIHLLFNRLSSWLTLENLTTMTIGATNISLVDKLKEWADRNRSIQNSPLVTVKERLDLQAYAHYYYARYFSLSDRPEDLKQALFEFSLFQLRHSTHLLFGVSLIDTAKTQLALGQKDATIDTLTLVEKSKLNISPIARQQASFLHGELLADRLKYTQAARAFKIATEANQQALSEAATINTGISYLAASNQPEFDQLIKTIDNKYLKTQLALEQALWLADNQSLEARPLLEKFLKDNPQHKRVIEIRLKLAKQAIITQPISVNISAKNIAILTAMSEQTDSSASQLNNQQLADLYTIKYQYATITANYPLAIEAASAYITRFPQSERVDEFILLKGQAFFRNGQQNQARRLLTKFTNEKPESPLSPYALYYASLAARLEGTPQSQQEAIALFEKVIKTKSPIQKEASLQLADLHRSLNQLDKAQDILTKIYTPNPRSALDRDIAMNLASTYHDLGTTDPLNYPKAIDIYNGILSDPVISDFWKNRVNYRKANTYQHMGDNLKAEETYYSVVNVDTKKKPITEWTWYYRCGFNAIAMLEEQANPKGAIAIAKKLAKSGGPRAAEAAERSRQLEMKYMIWQE